MNYLLYQHATHHRPPPTSAEALASPLPLPVAVAAGLATGMAGLRVRLELT